MSNTVDTQQLRRAMFRGYRLGDVELYVARTTLALEQLQRELDATRQKASAMQSEINDLHNRIDGSRRREAELDRTLNELRSQRDTLERETRERGETIVAEAERH